MKFIVSVLLTALLAYAFSLYLPWWCIALAAFITAIAIHQKPGKAFLSGAIGLFLLWGIQSAMLNAQNSGLLASKISHMFTQNNNAYLIIIIAAVVAFLVGGLAALSGSYLRK
jgi:hypothetical protein